MGATFDSVEELVHATKVVGELRMAICAAKTRAELFSNEAGKEVLQEALEQMLSIFQKR
ncbi:hypothetical protein MH050_06640 [Bacillus licheniformis]|uniref:hypothetical protein n=1 Tax=Bacillus licheniformis TaxID=1402 RepID=UPI0013826ABD|nr:hypothetical protein [Bacillus licheniformis]MCY7740530.1 hypothetical protein [Bacillus licheniformis]TWK94020.1 hypothetical protein CHCC20327_3707 [Bacillus licheniformis]